MPDHGHTLAEVRARIAAPPATPYLRDCVYGAVDGAVTTFAIVAGVMGAGLSPRVIIALGVANVLADGFSMAAANYSGTKAEADNARRLRAVEERHIDESPEGEMLELREILRTKGLAGAVLDAAAAAIARDRSKWIDLMLTDEYGLAPVPPHPLRAAIATFLAFLSGGSCAAAAVSSWASQRIPVGVGRHGRGVLRHRGCEKPLVAGAMVAVGGRDAGNRRDGGGHRLWCGHAFSRLNGFFDHDLTPVMPHRGALR